MGGEHGLALNAGMVYLVDFAIHIYIIPGLANTVVYLMYRTEAGIVYLSASCFIPDQGKPGCMYLMLLVQ